ncbi:MAG: terminase [Wohlfahrtiimonas sp.]
MKQEITIEDLKSKRWRLNNLYKITNKRRQVITFNFNNEQDDYFNREHSRNIILKARQLGFTTLKAIMQLDSAFFERAACGMIAHNLDDANKLFREKVKFAYDRLPNSLRLSNPASNDRAGELVFDKGGYIFVGTSARGGTLNELHVSEFGKICAKYPDKSKEIVTGAFEAVSKDGIITLESTAEGKAGYFYEYCQESQKLDQSKLGDLDWKFFFYDWFSNPEYVLNGNKDQITQGTDEYFDKLAHELNQEFSLGQKLWYQAKANTLKDEMKREYPSTPKEAFDQAIEGAYYAEQFRNLRTNGRIGKLPDNSHLPVFTYWDLGVGDSTSIWFVRKVGEEYHIIDFYENSGEGLRHYFKVLKDRGYNYATHYAPHDIQNREIGSDAKSRQELAREGYLIDGENYSIKFEVVPRQSVDGGIELAREILPLCAFDEYQCGKGLAHLEAYRKAWDDKNGVWRDKPLHNEASHAADAFRYFAVANNMRDRRVKRVALPF